MTSTAVPDRYVIKLVVDNRIISPTHWYQEASWDGGSIAHATFDASDYSAPPVGMHVQMCMGYKADGALLGQAWTDWILAGVDYEHSRGRTEVTLNMKGYR